MLGDGRSLRPVRSVPFALPHSVSVRATPFAPPRYYYVRSLRPEFAPLRNIVRSAPPTFAPTESCVMSVRSASSSTCVCVCVCVSVCLCLCLSPFYRVSMCVNESEACVHLAWLQDGLEWSRPVEWCMVSKIRLGARKGVS